MKNALFTRGPSQTLRFALLLIASVVIMIYDQKSIQLESIRLGLATAVHPVQAAVDLPARLSEQFNNFWTAKQTLRKDNHQLRETNQILSARLQGYTALQQENDQLRELLGAPARTESQFTTGRLLAVSMTPNNHKILIDKGSSDGVQEGVVIVDENGLMGQIIRTFPFHSEGMLISDPNHVVPIQVLRSGTRAVLAGTGQTDTMRLLHIPLTTDILEGDELVTSGLGGKFPADYPVAVVTSVSREPGSAFSAVTARPHANLDKARNILLLKASPRTLNRNSMSRATPLESGTTK